MKKLIKVFIVTLIVISFSSLAFAKDRPHSPSSPKGKWKAAVDAGMLCAKVGSVKVALKGEKKTMKFAEREFGKTSKEVAINLRNIGMYYYRLDKHKKAEDYMLKAIRMFEELYDEKEPDLPMQYSLVAMLYEKIGNKDKELEYLEKTVSAYEGGIAHLPQEEKVSFMNSIMGSGPSEDYYNYVNEIVDIYLERGRADDSIAVLNNATFNGWPFLDEVQYIHLRDRLADGYIQVKDNDSAVIVLEDILTRSRQAGNAAQEDSATQKLKKVYLSMGMSEDDSAKKLQELAVQ